jgi:hypothetical protein
VNGNGGASLNNTDFKKNDYPVQYAYPEPNQWKGYVKVGKRAVDAMGISKTLVGDVVGRIQKDVSYDFDPAGLLSFLMFEVQKNSVKVHHVCMDDVRLLFSPEMSVNIMDENPPVDATAKQRCVKDTIVI